MTDTVGIHRSRAVVEGSIARAHKALAPAIREASTFARLDIHDELQLIQLELERLQFDLLKYGQPRRKFLNNRA
jgi:hypothetical protein